MRQLADDAPLPRIPARESQSYKGDYGRALLVGGALGMTGAITLSGIATLRSGAGLVTLAVPECSLPIVAAAEPAYMSRPLPADDNGCFATAARRPLLELAEQMTAIGLGPGIGRTEVTTELVAALYNHVERPMVVDADGLFALAQRPEILPHAVGPRVLTPHAGEFARLIGADVPTVLRQRDELAARYAAQWNTVLIVKGPRSCIAAPDKLAHNTTGGPGLATGGTGDVLTGIITGLLCQGLEPFEAARLAAHVHGLAGDLAAADLGEISMISSDLLRYLPAAFRQVLEGLPKNHAPAPDPPSN